MDKLSDIDVRAKEQRERDRQMGINSKSKEEQQHDGKKEDTPEEAINVYVLIEHAR